MGLYDLPAEIDYILKETRERKLDYIGYGRGNTQMLYGMVKKSGYFSTRIKTFIVLGPALYYSDIHNVFDFTYYFDGFGAADVYAINGPTWLEDRERLCSGVALMGDVQISVIYIFGPVAI